MGGKDGYMIAKPSEKLKRLKMYTFQDNISRALNRVTGTSEHRTHEYEASTAGK